MVEPGSIVQITDPKHHWAFCLVVVSEMKSFGVQGYIRIPHDNSGNVGDAYIRLTAESYEDTGGRVIFAPGPDEQRSAQP